MSHTLIFATTIELVDGGYDNHAMPSHKTRLTAVTENGG